MLQLTWLQPIANIPKGGSGTHGPASFWSKSAGSDFFLDAQLLFFDLLHHRNVGRRPDLFFVQASLEPGVLGFERVDMG